MPNVNYKGMNSGGGNRAAAESVKSLHSQAVHNNSVISRTKPAKITPPGAPLSALKTPRRTHKRILD